MATAVDLPAPAARKEQKSHTGSPPCQPWMRHLRQFRIDFSRGPQWPTSRLTKATWPCKPPHHLAVEDGDVRIDKGVWGVPASRLPRVRHVPLMRWLGVPRARPHEPLWHGRSRDGI